MSARNIFRSPLIRLYSTVGAAAPAAGVRHHIPAGDHGQPTHPTGCLQKEHLLADLSCVE